MLRKALESLGRDTAIFGVSGAISKCIAIFTLPILTRILSKTEYGAIDAAIALTTGFAGLIILGQDAAVARFFYDEDSDEAHRQRVASSAVGLHAVMLVIFGLLFSAFGDSIGRRLYADNFDAARHWKLALWMLPGAVCHSFSINILKWTRQRAKYLVMTVGSSVAQIGLTIFLVLYLKQGVAGGIWAIILSTNAFALLGLFLISGYLRPRLMLSDFGLITTMLAYGLPFTVVMIPAIDRSFLLRFTDLEQVGVYAVGVKISGVLALCTSAFSLAFGPYAFSVWNEEHGAETLAKVCKIYFFIATLLAGLLAEFGGILIRVLASAEYLPVLVVLPPLLLAVVLGGLFEFGVLGILKSKKSHYHVMTQLFGLAMLLLCNYYFVPRFAILGAAISLLLAKASVSAFAFWISNRYYKLPIEYMRMMLVFLIWVAHSGLVYLDYLGLHQSLGWIKPGATLLLPWIGALVVFDENERQGIARWFKGTFLDIVERVQGGGAMAGPASANEELESSARPL